MVTVEELITYCRRAGGDWLRHIRFAGLSGAFFAPEGNGKGIHLKGEQVRALGRALGWRESPAGADQNGVARLHEVALP
ncbi:hypothetical protein BMI91_13190 [Thioclava sediminum]|uniref:Type II toxin-antitoxin system HicA family toxin n=1 Tax=Thioclava sediminum TaxID=1915319 RepID=A0ABX3MUR8_9RHOB|nr:hypothetical protein [Thioclava sediminum]OOY23442.1 hypothetical protein BMI91_13190 [Thioclava sediminum]